MAYQHQPTFVSGGVTYSNPNYVDYSTVRTFPALQQKSDWWESNIMDPLRSFGAGANSMLGSVGWLTERLGAEDFGEAISEFAKHGVEYWNDKITPETQEQLRKDMFDVTDQGVDFNFTKLVNGITGSAPSMVVGLGAGGAIAKGLQMFGNPIGRAVLANSINSAKGALPTSLAFKKGAEAAKSLQFIDRMFLTTGFAAGEGVLAGAGVGAEVAESIKAMPHEKLMERSERYRSLYESYDGEDDARRQQLAKGALADEASTDAGWKAGFTTSVLGAPAGAFFGRILGKHSTRLYHESEKLAGMSGGRFATAVEGFATEGVTESLQSAGEQLITNLGVQQADSSRDTWEGVGEAAIEGGLIGGVMGGGIGGIAGNPEHEESSRKLRFEADQRATDQHIEQQLELIAQQGLDADAEVILAKASEGRDRVATLRDLTYLAQNGEMNPESYEELYGAEDFEEVDAVEPDEGDQDDDGDDGAEYLEGGRVRGSEALVSGDEPGGAGSSASPAGMDPGRDNPFAGLAREAADQLEKAGDAEGAGSIRMRLEEMTRPKAEPTTKAATENSESNSEPGDIRFRITPEQAKDTNVKVELPAEPEFQAAVAGTPGAEITSDGLRLGVTRYQKPEQAGDQSVRTGVFYLPSGASQTKAFKGIDSDSNRDMWYGGTEKQEGETLIRRPLVVKGVTGGEAPEKAYSAVGGDMKKLYFAIGRVVDSSNDKRIVAAKARELLAEYGADPGLADHIVRNSKVGNQLRYALQENVIAHAVRKAGYDAVVSHNRGKLTEIFDVREITYPDRAVPSQVHPAFDKSEPTSDLRFRLKEAAESAATSPTNDLKPPTQAQAAAGNTKLGHDRVRGLSISIENPAGSDRVLKKRDGTIKMKNHYGYIRGITGADGQKLDVFLHENAHDESKPIFVVEQQTPDGVFDEHKVYMGFDNDKAVRESFLAHQQLKPAMRAGPKIRKFDSPRAMMQWAREQEQVFAAKAKGYEIESSPEGSLRVRGDMTKIREAIVAGGVKDKGRQLKDERGEYLEFTPAAGAGARAALTGGQYRVSRAGKVLKHQIDRKTQKIVGAPAKYSSKAGLAKLRAIAKSLTVEGEYGRFWYEESSQDILDFTGSKEDAIIFVNLLAIYSPQAKVDSNTTFAIKAYFQGKAGLPIKVKTGDQDAKAEKVFAGKSWGGEKTNNFYLNLMSKIEPDLVAGSQGATIDMWMMRAFGYDTDAPTSAQYRFVEIENNRIANELGWEPQQVQAAIWVAMKSRTENKGVKDKTEAESIAAGDMTKVGNTRTFTDKDAAARHRQRWLKNALAHTPTKRDEDDAGFHFGNGLKAHRAQLSWEAVPSKNLVEHAWIHNNMEAKLELQARIQSLIGDKIMRETGILNEGAVFGFGGWNGDVSPSAQELFVAGSQYDITGKPETRRVTPEIKKRADAAAAIYGLLLQQDGVAWHRPLYGSNVGSSNGVHLEYGAPLDAEQTAKLYNAVVENAIKAGLTKEQAQGIAPIPNATGVRFLNFSDIPNAKFHKLVKSAAETAIKADAKMALFKSDGSLITDTDDKGYADGQGYRNRIADAGFGDQLGRLESSLGSEIERIHREVAAKYGKETTGTTEQPRFRLRERSTGSDSGVSGRAPSKNQKAGVAPSPPAGVPAFAANKIQPDAVHAVGVHYSPIAGLKALDPTQAGSQFAGGERRRLGNGRFGLTNPRINFYVGSEGRERAIGTATNAYTVQLNNLYDIEADPRGLRAEAGQNPSYLEELVSEAGFDGILFPPVSGIPSKTAVVFGFKRGVPVAKATASNLMFSLSKDSGTIDVDGTQRPVTDSTGKRIHPTDEGIRNFYRWFGKSQVVDDQGHPMVMYTGTSKDADFDKFNVPRNGAWFTRWPEVASEYAIDNDSKGLKPDPDAGPWRYKEVNTRERVIPVYLRIENGRWLNHEEGQKVNVTNYKAAQKVVFDGMRAQGHDGAHFGPAEWVVLGTPDQIKSAIGNSGAFSPRDKRVQFSLGGEPKPGLSTAAVQGLINTLAWHGKEQIKVYATEADIPNLVETLSRKNAEGKDNLDKLGQIQGYYDFETRSVVIVAGNIKNPEEAYRTVVEEFLRHQGLRRFFTGAKLDPFLDSLYSSLPQDALRDLAVQYGTPGHPVDLTKESGRRLVAEEYIAKIKTSQIKSPLMTRLGDWFRSQLRAAGFKFKYTNGEIIHILQQIEDGMRSGRFASSAWDGNGIDPIAPAFSLTGKSDKWYYSALERSVQEGKGAPKKGNASAWKGWLDGAGRRGEFKQAERDWIGVDQWLDGRGETTRQELQQFIADNAVELEETVLGDPELPEGQFTEDGLPKGWEIDGRQQFGQWHYEVTDERGIVIKSGDDRSEVLNEAKAYAQRQGLTEGAPPKFGTYVLPGGANYRELLLTLPGKRDDRKGVAMRLFGKPVSELTDEQFDAVSDELDGMGKLEKQYRSSHWDQPNVLVHVRLNERTDADGKRVLFVEEVQSDWHQAGRRKGYAGDKTSTFKVFLKPHSLPDGGSVDEWVVRDQTGAETSGPFASEEEAIAARDADQKHFDRISKQQAVPNAPLKKEWPLTVMKRVIRYAAENGFDRIAWTTGEQQNDRYDLSKQVDSLSWTSSPHTKGQGNLLATKNGSEIISKQGVKESDLADLIGKDAAEKLLAAKPSNAGIGSGRQERVISGIDLKMGGSGMRGFYDTMLPTEVGKYVRKWGAKVETRPIDKPREPAREMSPETASILANFPTYEAKILDAQPSIDITPAMRSSALAGQPLFRLKSAVGSPSQAIAGSHVQPARPYEMSLGDRFRGLIREVVDKWKAEFGLKMEQGLFDAGASIKNWEKRLMGAMQDASVSAGKMYDLAKNPAAVLSAAMRIGVPKLKDGAFQPVAGRKGLVDIFRPLYEHGEGNLVHLWEDYAYARRANRLIQEQNRDGTPKEKRLTQAQIDDLLLLEGRFLDAQGNSVFKKVFDDWQTFNNQLLDFAVENGTLSAQTRALWAQNDYVPFYRVMETVAAGAAGPSTKGSFSGRDVRSKRLSGADLAAEPILESIIKNTAYVLDAVYKNEAMKRTVNLLKGHALTRAPTTFQPTKFKPEQIEKALADAGIVMLSERNVPPSTQRQFWSGYKSNLLQLNQQELEAYGTMFSIVAPTGANVVSVMEGGKPVYYHADDPLVLASILAIGPQSMSGIMRLMSGAKTLLTDAVTADPGFMMVNFLRDTISAWVTSDAPFKPVLDGMRGAVKSMKEDPIKWQLQMAGASLGGHYDKTGKDAYQSLESDVGAASWLSVGNNWRRWRAFGAHFENANRIAIGKAIIDSGGTVAEAAYQALDVMNFSMHGDYKSVRALTSIVPFMNARMQGLYRLYRGRNAPSFYMRGAVITAATLALMASNWDDERYWELEDFDRDQNWHFWVGDQHWKVAKPFEVGQIFGTIWERTFATAFGRDTARLLVQRMGAMVKDTFAMDPTPQIVKPLIEQYANKNSFTGRPIENMSLSGLLPEDRYMPWTSETARVFARALPDWAPAWLRSPVRVEAMLRGYFGTVGMYALQASDQISRPLGGFGEPPSTALKDMPVVRRFYAGDQATKTRYEEPIYRLLDEANQAQKSIKELRRRGLNEQAKATALDHKEIIAARGRLNSFSNQMRAFNMRERVIWNSGADPDEKQRQIEAIREQRNDAMRRAATLIEELDAYMDYL